MRRYAKPLNGDTTVISGESGAATFGTVVKLLENPDFETIREKLGINSQSVILLINTEGDTDPVCYQSIVERWCIFSTGKII